MEVETGWCDVCRARRRLERPPFNTGLHACMAIITVGIWIPFWLISAFWRHGWRCMECGSDYVFVGDAKVAEGLAFYQPTSPTMFCTRCGAGLPYGAAFCSGCGHALNPRAIGE